MTATTIKVASSTRDRLKAQAAQAGVPMGAHLEHLMDFADRDDRFRALRRAMHNRPADERYLSERDEWLGADLA